MPRSACLKQQQKSSRKGFVFLVLQWRVSRVGLKQRTISWMPKKGNSDELYDTYDIYGIYFQIHGSMFFVWSKPIVSAEDSFIQEFDIFEVIIASLS